MNFWFKFFVTRLTCFFCLEHLPDRFVLSCSFFVFLLLFYITGLILVPVSSFSFLDWQNLRLLKNLNHDPGLRIRHRFEKTSCSWCWRIGQHQMSREVKSWCSCCISSFSWEEKVKGKKQLLVDNQVSRRRRRRTRQESLSSAQDVYSLNLKTVVSGFLTALRKCKTSESDWNAWKEKSKENEDKKKESVDVFLLHQKFVHVHEI